ncbi:MAG: phage virion morphogenesis protein [Gammaproteobacteria bacterium]|nr:phage virion morphogenesis protein [Gammaproteobacteria bacterium]
MAGSFVPITITIDNARINSALERLARAMGPRLPVALNKIGLDMVEATKLRFPTQTDPDGAAWTPLTDKYLRSKRKRESRNPNAILVRDRTLLDSIRHQTGTDEVSWGTNLPYGATHQFGRPEQNLPARPYLGLSAEDERTVLDVIHDHLDAAVEG